MPVNRIRIVFDKGEVTCKVWDKYGNKYNVSDIFKEIRGQVALGGIWSTLSLRHGMNSLETCLSFVALRKDLKFDVEESVVNQVLEMGADPDSSPDDE